MEKTRLHFISGVTPNFFPGVYMAWPFPCVEKIFAYVREVAFVGDTENATRDGATPEAQGGGGEYIWQLSPGGGLVGGEAIYTMMV